MRIFLFLIVFFDFVQCEASFLFVSPFQKIFISDYITTPNFKGVLILLVDWTPEGALVKDIKMSTTGQIESIILEKAQAFHLTAIKVRREEYIRLAEHPSRWLLGFIAVESYFNTDVVKSSKFSKRLLKIKPLSCVSHENLNESLLNLTRDSDDSDFFIDDGLWRIVLKDSLVGLTGNLIFSIFFHLEKTGTKENIFTVDQEENGENDGARSFLIKQIRASRPNNAAESINFMDIGNNNFSYIRSKLKEVYDSRKVISSTNYLIYVLLIPLLISLVLIGLIGLDYYLASLHQLLSRKN